MLCPSCHTENDPSALTCAACRTALPGTTEGAVLAGRYEIRSCLGKGGMGVVYKAHDRVLDEVVAIKVLLDRKDADPGAGRRFRSEIKLARKVTHRNVCRIHDYGEDGGLQYISMQFVEGSDLREQVRRDGGLPAGHAYDVALQIAEGLQAIHDEGIVHRDLKTANVMIDGQGVVRLMDFGIAKDTAGGESLTITGAIVGTPEYMSPEQIHGQELDARSDLYSLGIILFELFTGRVPFTAATPVALLMKHLHEAPPLDDGAASAIPPAVREVIRKSMAKDPGGRYRSARELAEALKRARDAGVAPRLEPPATSKADDAAIPRLPDARARGRRWAWTLIAPPLVALGMWAGWRVLAALVTPSPQPSPTPAAIATAATPSPISTPTPAELVSRGASSPPVAAGSCEEGNAAACTRLGVRYNTGQGVEKDVATAAEFYEKGCNGGDAQGCNNLGSLHEFGLIGIGPDPVRAAGLYQRACDRGDAQGCGNLGIVSLDDPGRRDEAIRLLREACSKGASRPCRKLQELGLAP